MHRTIRKSLRIPEVNLLKADKKIDKINKKKKYNFSMYINDLIYRDLTKVK